MGTTTNYGLPWPDRSERFRDADLQIRALAEAIDSLDLGGGGGSGLESRVTALESDVAAVESAVATLQGQGLNSRVNSLEATRTANAASFTTGVVTADTVNTGVADVTSLRLGSFPNYQRANCRVARRTGTVSLPGLSWQTISWQSNETNYADDGSLGDTPGSTLRFPLDGVYIISFSASVNTGNHIFLRLITNGGTVFGSASAIAPNQVVTLTQVAWITSSTTLTCQVYVNGSGTFTGYADGSTTPMRVATARIG